MKFRRADNRPSRRPRQLHHRFLHRDGPTWLTDSFRGLRLALRLLFGWIDLNFCVTADGHLVNVHWPRPLEHGYHDPLGLLDPHTPVSQMTVEEATRLVSPRGDRVHTAEEMLAAAGRDGLRGVELEVKPDGHHHPTYKRACSVVDAAHEAGVRLVAKTLVQPGGPRMAVRRLRPFHRAGATTLLLTHGHAAFRSCWPVVDHVRGRVTWTGPQAKEK